MINRVLIDTNILLDYLLTREPYFYNADKMIQLCTAGNVKACIASHSVANMFYIMRKDVEPHKRREMLIDLCMIFDVIEVDRSKLITSLTNEMFSDFEDCLQVECAKEYKADYIITRNINDYKKSEIPALTPEVYLEMFG
jgi:predicted nucleic acid-binding protein